MPKKRDDGLPGEKLLLLYQLLTQEKGRHYLSDLAPRLGRSVQTVSRMIDVVESHLGKDVLLERGMDGRRRYFQVRMARQGSTEQMEALRFLRLCRDLTCMLPEAVALPLDQALTTLTRQLPNIPAASGGVGFRSKGFIDYSPHLGIITQLREAIGKRQVCQIFYHPTGRPAPAIYRHAPGRLVAMNGTLYLQGYRLTEGLLLKERPTTFSLHRIKSVTPTGEFFHFNPVDTESQYFGLDWHAPKQMRVHIAASAADYVRDRIWSEGQTIEDQPDGSILLSVTTTSEKELMAWVMSFGKLATLIEPQANSVPPSSLHCNKI